MLSKLLSGSGIDRKKTSKTDAMVRRKKMRNYLFFIVAFLLLVGVWDTLIVMNSDLTWSEGIVASIIMTCGTIATFDNIRQKSRSR